MGHLFLLVGFAQGKGKFPPFWQKVASPLRAGCPWKLGPHPPSTKTESQGHILLYNYYPFEKKQITSRFLIQIILSYKTKVAS